MTPFAAFHELTQLFRAGIGSVVLLVAAVPLHVLLVRPILSIFELEGRTEGRRGGEAGEAIRLVNNIMIPYHSKRAKGASNRLPTIPASTGAATQKKRLERRRRRRRRHLSAPTAA